MKTSTYRACEQAWMHGLPIGRTTGGAPITRRWKAARSWWNPKENKMAVDHKSIGGQYNKKVPDSGDGQSRSKFSNPIKAPTDNLPKPSQKINTPIDSKDSKIGK